MIENYINHLRDREYMTGADRTINRIKATAEVFSPTELAIKMVNKLDWSNPNQSVLDPAVGDGQLVSEILIKKLQLGISLPDALKTIFGVDIMIDNVMLTRERLLCNHPEYRYIVDKNITVGDGLKFGMEQQSKLF